MKSYEEFLDDYNLIKLEEVQKVLDEIVNQYMNKKLYDDANTRFEEMVSYLSLFAKNNIKAMKRVPSDYFNAYLETFGFYLINYGINLFSISKNEKAIEVLGYAGMINVRGNAAFFENLDNMVFNISMKSGKMPKVLLKEKYKNGLEYKEAIKNLEEMLDI